MTGKVAGKDVIVLYIATYIIDIAALLYLLWLLRSDTALNIYRKKPLMIGAILTVIMILSEAGTVFTGNGSSGHRIMHIICNVIGFAFTPIIPIVITLIFDRRILAKHKILLVPTLINTVAVILSPLYGFIFYVDAGNRYVRGKFFFIFITAYIINLLILFFCTLDTGKKHNYPIMRKLTALSLFTITGTSIQLAFPSVYSSWHCVTLSLLLYFFLMSEFNSSFDTLTGMYNRAAFEKAAKHMSEAKAFSVIVFDINDFKSINDEFGHDYGDTVIKAVAAIILKSFDNKNYTCYRFGGDEFFIIAGETEQEKIECQLRIVINNLAEENKRGNPLPTVSYGYSIFPGGEKPDFDKILKEADNRMYQHKSTNKAAAR